MNVMRPADRDQWWAPPTPACFMCGIDVPKDAIATYWAGQSGTTILLHIECAERLGRELIGDAREANLARGDNIWGDRAVSLVRDRLKREEGHKDEDIPLW